MPVKTAQHRTLTILDNSYELVQNLGRGARSTVYRARPLDSVPAAIDGSFVAIKIFADTELHPQENIEQVNREAMALLSTRNEHIVRLLDYVANEQVCYLVLELAAEGSLTSLLEKNPKGLPVREALSILRELAVGLSAIHRSGIIHRDIKPENVLFGENRVLRISDFGVAVLPTDRIQERDESADIGTLDYMSPEVLEFGLISPAMDLYAAALTGFQMITGRLPFESPSMTEHLSNKLSGRRIAIENTGDVPHLESFFDRALAPDPRDRFETARDLIDGIDRILAGEAVPAAVRQEPRRKSGSRASMTMMLTPEAEVVEPTRRSEDSLRRLRALRVAHNNIAVFGIFTALKELFGRIMRSTARERLLTLCVLFMILSISLGLQALFTKESAEARIKNESAIAHTSFTRSMWQGLRELIWDTEVPAYALFRNLNSGTHIGTISGLFTDSDAITIFTEGAPDERKFFFSLGMAGWNPQPIVLSPTSKSREIRISGSGLQLSLWLNKNIEEDANTLSGVFKDHSTGREGRWQIVLSPKTEA